MTASVFDNPHIGIKPTLFFDIEIPLEPFELDGEMRQTAVELCFIQLPVSDWRDVEGQEYRFPVNPEDGYIDGSVYLGGVHNPADTTLIRFGRLDGDSITAAFEILLDFQSGGAIALGLVPVKWTLPLVLDARELDEVVAEARRKGAIAPRRKRRR